jgi:hypothetical protein
MSPAPVATQQKGAGLMSYDEYAKGRHSSPYVIEIQVGEGALLSKHDEPIETYMDHELKRLTGIPGLEGQPRNFAELEKSCLWLSPRLREWREAPQSWFSPMDSQAYTNQVSRLTAEFRDQHMVKLLVDEVKQGKKVFAVVGFSHVVMQESVLRAALRSK